MQYTTPLKLNHVFRRLYAKGENAVGSFFVVYCRRNGLRENRLGLTVSTKLGKAVVRNRARRRLREVYRLSEDRLKCGYDVVIVARSRRVDAPFAELTAAFIRQCARLGLLRQTP